mmetsp:Transcript_12400/g.19969  ORF Transcript_12400/g.19969 Transcript_12400/m.19969 type:complete len:167 (-) Transcript_12400:181-681(-)
MSRYNGICFLFLSWLTLSSGFVPRRQSHHVASNPLSPIQGFSAYESSKQCSPFRSNNRIVVEATGVLRRQRRSVAHVQTMGLFGLGAAEIAVILVVVAFVLGPDQIGRMAGNMAGKVKGEYEGLPDDLKRIPEEFQKGMEESTENARARNAKKMEAVPDEEGKDKK